MAKFLCEPLLHFLSLGLVLFLVSYSMEGDSAEDDPFTIVVDQERLADFLRFRNKLRAGLSRDITLDQLSRDQFERLVDDYVEEEAMYREAKALQLDGDDYLARLRAIQRLEFIMRQTSDEASEPIDGDTIRSYFDSHREEFLVAPTITFTHVYFSADLHGHDRARQLAEAEQEKLNALGVELQDASRYGDRFLYHLNYVGTGYDEVRSHFGDAMLDRLVAIEPDTATWRGPLQSPHGSHIVMIARKSAAHLPPLDDVRADVERRVRQSIQAEDYKSLRRRVLDKYRVSVQEVSIPGRHDQPPLENSAPETERAAR